MPYCDTCRLDYTEKEFNAHFQECYAAARAEILAKEAHVDRSCIAQMDIDSFDPDYAVDNDDPTARGSPEEDSEYDSESSETSSTDKYSDDEEEQEQEQEQERVLELLFGTSTSGQQYEQQHEVSTPTVDDGVSPKPFHICQSNPKQSKTMIRSLGLYAMTKKENVPRRVVRSFLAFINTILAEENLADLALMSEYKAEKRMIEAYQVKTQDPHICPKGCMLFMGNETSCDKCQTPRYSEKMGPCGKPKPRATMKYIPLQDQLALLLGRPQSRERIRDLRQLPLQTGDNVLQDIFNGSTWIEKQKSLFTGRYDIALGLYVDGFKPFKRTKKSLALVHLIVLNLSPMERYLDVNMVQVAVLPSGAKTENIFSFLSPLLEELRSLQSRGIMVTGSDGEAIISKAHLLFATGDIPGAALLCNHEGHQATYGCRICTIQTVPLLSVKGKGKGRYFPGSEDPDQERQLSDFVSTGALGLRGPTPFAELHAFHGPYYFGLDELHLIGSNIAPHLWKMTCADSESPFSLPNTVRNSIGFCVTQSTDLLPATFEGRMIDVFRTPKHARSVDWIDMLLYVGPTLLVESFESSQNCDTDAIGNFINLIIACGLALRWEIDDEDIGVMEECVQGWHFFARSSLPHNLYTSCMHYIQHLPTAVRKLGPPRSYSARSMERTIGVISRRIKSKSQPEVNAGNELLRAAACRDYNLVSEALGMSSTTTLHKVTTVDNTWYQIGDSTTEPQIWNVTRNEKTTTYSRWNLHHHLRRYWQRSTKDMYTSDGTPVINPPLPEIETGIIVGAKYHNRGNVIDSKIFVSIAKKRKADFVQITIPYDIRSSNVRARVDPKWGTFFGEIQMFFVHKFKDTERLLCLIRIYTKVKLNEAGMPYGPESHGNPRSGKLYVTDAAHIDGASGYILSSEFENRLYYVTPGMTPYCVRLGDASKLVT